MVNRIGVETVYKLPMFEINILKKVWLGKMSKFDEKWITLVWRENDKKWALSIMNADYDHVV